MTIEIPKSSSSLTVEGALGYTGFEFSGNIKDTEVPAVHRYEPVGSALQLFKNKSPEILLSGAAGTGKSRACLEKIHTLCLKYPGIRCLIVRKTAESLAKSAMVTYQEHVAPEAISSGEVRYYGGSAREPASFKYANTSVVITGGMDKATRVMSSEYDVIYVQEATELTEEDWEMLTSRLRNGRMPYQQLIADCNPGHPQHWLKQRSDAGKTHMIYCSHRDNPTLWKNGEWTDHGKRYVETNLAGLTGVRRERLYEGKWAAAEGLVYDTFDPSVHIYDQVTPFRGQGWNWYFSVDFGFTNPFVCQAWAEDRDGRIYLFREIYMTGKIVEDHAKDILAMMNENKRYHGWKIPKPRAIICDSADPESIKVLEKHLGMACIPAYKDIAVGVEAVKSRLKVQADGKPRLYICREALYRSDSSLEIRKKPTCTRDEILGYVWDQRATTGASKELPLKVDDHGMDAMRYMVAHMDTQPTPRIRSFTL